MISECMFKTVQGFATYTRDHNNVMMDEGGQNEVPCEKSVHTIKTYYQSLELNICDLDVLERITCPGDSQLQHTEPCWLFRQASAKLAAACSASSRQRSAWFNTLQTQKRLYRNVNYQNVV